MLLVGLSCIAVPYKCDHEIILMVDTRDIHTNLLMDKLCMDVISIPVKNYIIASIGILNCELLWIFIY